MVLLVVTSELNHSLSNKTLTTLLNSKIICLNTKKLPSFMEKTKRLFLLDLLRKIIMKTWKSKINYLIKMDKLNKKKEAMMMIVLKKYAMLFSK